MAIGFTFAHRLGPKVCLVKLDSTKDKVRVMSKKSRLKHNVEKEIYINNDLIWRERWTQKRIREEVQRESKESK